MAVNDIIECYKIMAYLGYVYSKTSMSSWTLDANENTKSHWSADIKTIWGVSNMHYSGCCKGALARLVDVQDGNLQVGSSTPALHKKKSLRLFPFPKHSLGSGLTHKVTGHYVWVGTGVWKFSWPVWEGILLNSMPWGHSFPPQVKFFFIT